MEDREEEKRWKEMTKLKSKRFKCSKQGCKKSYKTQEQCSEHEKRHQKWQN